jgi:hypothetical protein
LAEQPTPAASVDEQSNPPAPPEPRIFSPEFAHEMRTMAYIRAEIAITIVLDGGLLLVAIGVRAILLSGLHWLAPDDAMDWSLKIVEWVLNFGLVGTVIIFTGFDLLKRIRNGYRAWKHDQ